MWSEGDEMRRRKGSGKKSSDGGLSSKIGSMSMSDQDMEKLNEKSQGDMLRSRRSPQANAGIRGGGGHGVVYK